MSKPFPPELQALAKAKAEAVDRHNALMFRNQSTDINERAADMIEMDIAYRERIAAGRAFDKALDEYLASCRDCVNGETA